MFLWFIALSVAAVLLIFDSPYLDYRLIAAGSVLPLLDHLWGPAWVLHTVLAPVAAMMAVMVVGWGRRLWQRRWLGVAIGMMVHLLLDGTWRNREVFWWPGFGSATQGPNVPGLELAVVAEAVGAIVIVWLWFRLKLSEPEHRSKLIRTGHVDRSSLRGRGQC